MAIANKLFTKDYKQFQFQPLTTQRKNQHGTPMLVFVHFCFSYDLNLKLYDVSAHKEKYTLSIFALWLYFLSIPKFSRLATPFAPTWKYCYKQEIHPEDITQIMAREKLISI